ncbi:MAG: recombinase family protein [Chloroflexota bacterium]
MPIQCVTYGRVSPKGHGDSGEPSLEVQASECVRFAQERGWEIVAQESDQGASGDDDERPGLWRAVNALPQGGILLAWKRDRLFRSDYFGAWLEIQLRKKGCRIQTTQREGSEGDDPYSELLRGIIDLFSSFELKMIRLRTRTAMRHHQKNGRRMSDRPPYGWKRDPAEPSRLVENGPQQGWLWHMQQWAKEGISPCMIAGRLEAIGAPTASGIGSWTATTVRRILKRAL